MMQRSALAPLAGAAILALAGLMAVPSLPARADPPRDQYDRDHDRDHRGHRPPPRPDYYRGPIAPAPVYAPPAVVYQPAPVSPGINLIIPFNFR